MFRTICFAIVLFCSLQSSAAVPSETPEQYSKKELKALMQSASTPEEYQKLSNHFRAEAARLSREAEEQEASMRRELVRPTRLKFPSAYDIAGRLRDNYRRDAQKAEEKAAGYERLMRSAGAQTNPR